MYEYKDPEKAAEWFARTTPEEQAHRRLRLHRGPREGPEWQTIVADIDRAGSEVEALLKDFGLDLLGFGQGVDAVLSELTRRPDAAMRRLSQRGDDAEFKYDSYCVVRLDPVTWTWLRPLLVELAERRRQEKTG